MISILWSLEDGIAWVLGVLDLLHFRASENQSEISVKYGAGKMIASSVPREEPLYYR